MNLFGLTQRNIKFILCLGGEVFDFHKFFSGGIEHLCI